MNRMRELGKPLLRVSLMIVQPTRTLISQVCPPGAAVFLHLKSSIPPGLHVLSNQGSSGE